MRAIASGACRAVPGGMPGCCRLGDRAKAPLDVHGCPLCPHHDVLGPAISASANVFINGSPALRIDDIGMHAACCGTNMWKVIAASGTVFVNGSAIVRKGDTTQHCGGIGQMIDASANVVDGSPMTMKGPFSGVPPLPPLPLNQVMVYPSEETQCISPVNKGGMVQTPGLPTSGDPQIYDANAAARERAKNLPHAGPGPTEEEREAGYRRMAAGNWIAGNEEGYEENLDKANEIKARRRYDALREQISQVQEGLNQHFEKKEKVEELERQMNDAKEDYERYQRAAKEGRTVEPRIEEEVEGL